MIKKVNRNNRMVFFDNIRLAMIILVVLVHTSVTYSGIGGWYYIENKSVGTISKIIFAMFNTFSQAYFMGILFLIAGYFVPGSYDKKGFGKFIKDRFIRLGIPVVVYIFIIHPFIEYFIKGVFINRKVPQFIQYYSSYIKPFIFLGCTGPLWFALALLMFSLVYALMRIFIKHPYQFNKYNKVPNHISIVVIIMIISLLTFIVRIFQPFGVSIMNMQLCFFSQYIVLFILGILAYRYEWFEKLSYSFGVLWFKVGIVLGLAIWVALMLFGGPLSGKEYVIFGGLYWQSAVYAFWEQLLCAGMCLGLIVVFRDKLNYQGRIVKSLSDNGFGIYVFHAPILITISLALRNIYIHPIIKFLLVAFIALVATFCFTYLIRKIPLFKKIFS